MKKLLLLICLTGCALNEVSNDNNADYIQQRDVFDSHYVSHFPDELSGNIYTMLSNQHTAKNDVGFLLYQYDVPDDILKERETFFRRRSIAHYKPSDSCLIVVNSFETLKTLEERIIVTAIDTALLREKERCSTFPIPSFIDVKAPVLTGEVKLNEHYTIYVLEARQGVFDKRLQLNPSAQMPSNWGNGFSRGVAVNPREKVLIYWFVMW